MELLEKIYGTFMPTYIYVWVYICIDLKLSELWKFELWNFELHDFCNFASEHRLVDNASKETLRGH